ncbi:STAS domain-containing protein [Cryptosporangium aurantiacum]|nr:STAS domain-containing protein [Cryptosporangium aurantiacum]
MHTGRSESLVRCDLTRSGECLAITGEIDEANASALADRIGAALADRITLLDLRGVTFFSAAGVRMLLLVGPAVGVTDSGLRVRCSTAVWRIVALCGVAEVSGLLFEPSTRAGTDTSSKAAQ